MSPLLSGVLSVLLYSIVRYLVLNASDPIARGLLCLPVFYGITMLINVFTIVHDGSSRKCVVGYARAVFYMTTVGIILTF